MANTSKERAMFLIDGSNFYYRLQGAGISKGELSFRKLVTELANGRDIVGVEYFICPATPRGSHEVKKQQRFFSRLHQDRITLKKGVLVERERTCQSCNTRQKYWIEKGVDVHLAMSLVVGAVEDAYDVAYLLSCDADFVPVVEYAKSKGKKVFLVAPKGAKYHALQNVCSATILVDQAMVNLCQAF